jgi:hypothetical protein
LLGVLRRRLLGVLRLLLRVLSLLLLGGLLVLRRPPTSLAP